ncbi:MAG: zinc-ribbon domain-containing protein [Pseudomonadota bacterium]|nr:zinc-ribbon domain-containing protein [Pseudomonadota bacterium]
MRVTCPSCKAVYEAPDDELGAGGRRVECSACGEQWFQAGPELAAFDPAPSRMPGMEAAAQSLSSLREPEPEPAAPPAPATPSRQLEAEQAGLDPLPPLRDHHAGPRRPASIDAERLSAELRARDETAQRGASGGGSGFAAGVLLALIVSGALAFAYLQSGKVVAALPQAEPYVARYVETVDRLRLAVERAADEAKARIDDLSGQG